MRADCTLPIRFGQAHFHRHLPAQSRLKCHSE